MLALLKRIFDNLEEYLLVFALGSMVIYIFIQIIFRYIFSLPLAWSEELSRFTFVWLIYLGASLAVKRSRHLRVDAALFLYPKAFRPYVTLLGDLLFLLFAIVIAKETATLAYTITFIRPQVSPAMQIPMGLAYLAIPVSFGLMICRIIQNIATFFRTNLKQKASSSVDIMQR